MLHFDLLDTVLVAGFVNAGLYGFLPIAIILSYRISRTIAFVHGGIAAAAALTYWILSVQAPFLPNYLVRFGNGQDPTTYGSRPELDPFVAMLLAVAMGAGIGAVYGAVVMSRRMATLAVLTLTSSRPARSAPQACWSPMSRSPTTSWPPSASWPDSPSAWPCF